MFYTLNRLFEPRSDASEATIQLVNLLNLKITASTLQREIEEHPNYPTLFSISDVLNKFGIDNIGIRPDPEKFSDIPTPFITRIRNEKNYENFFTVVKENTSDGILYYDQEKMAWRRVQKNNFLERWHGFALMAKIDTVSDERDYLQKRKAEKKRRLTFFVRSFSLPILVIVFGLLELLRVGTSAMIPFTYLILCLVGSVTSLLLVLYEIDDKNAMLNQICSASKKVNCKAVLHSNASKIADISWSAVGLSYFSGQVLLLLFKGLENPSIHLVLSWGSLFTIPYIIFSLYYQWRVIKQWCILCLIVQSILIIQFLTADFSGWLNGPKDNPITFSFLSQCFCIFAISFFFILILFSLLQKSKEGVNTGKDLQRIKHNQELFWGFLQQQKFLTADPGGLGITIGDPKSKYKILKVCNPYCRPCSKAHEELHHLLDSIPEVQLQIIFTATTNEEIDSSTKVVKHFLAISQNFNESKVKKMLDDWYTQSEKDYNSFSTKYPINGELNQQLSKIDTMRKWCEKIEIDSTPTIFVSIYEGSNEHSERYYQLPSIYSIRELEYLFERAEGSQAHL